MKGISLKLAMGMMVLILTGGVFAAGGKNESRRGGAARDQMGSSGEENTNGQWTADPERGWLRAKERHQQQRACRRAASKRGSSHSSANCASKETDGKELHLENRSTDLGVDY